MPIDPRIPLGARGIDIDVPGTLAGISQMRAQQQQMQQQAELHQARMQDYQGQQQERQAGQMIEQRLRQLFSGETLPTPQAIYSAVGPERGQKIVQGLAALQTENQKAYASTQEIIRDVLGGMDAVPENLRAELYPSVRENLLTRGIIKPEDAPEQYDAGWFTQARAYGRKLATPEPYTLTPGSKRFGADNTVVAEVPAVEPKLTYGAPQTQLVNGKRTLVRAGSDGRMYDMSLKPIEAANIAPEPEAGRKDEYMWAQAPDGTVKLMTPQEIRALGGKQPPTADMRNKEASKAVAAKAVDAVRTLGANIFTKVGPAQRVEAIKRGAEAVWGTDPEFRTYQDARMALAGTLAVEQQGSRVSDADVKALWLPMVPDAYRDTKESYELKWSLIDTMRGAAPRQDGAGEQSRGGVPKVGDTFNGGRVIKVTPIP